MNKVVLEGSLFSVLIGRGTIGISYLFFADDILVFCKANSLEWSRLLHLLEKYELAYDQMLNKKKTSIFFSKKTPQDVKENIINLVGIKPLVALKIFGLTSYDKEIED